MTIRVLHHEQGAKEEQHKYLITFNEEVIGKREQEEFTSKEHDIMRLWKELDVKYGVDVVLHVTVLNVQR